jgi:DNA-binding CsgD family transcriptional regulator
MFTELAGQVRNEVPFNGSLWFGVDPATLLPTAPALIDNIEPGHCETYWQRELLVEDAMLFRDLARAPQPTAALRQVTDDRPARSARWREFLAPQGFDDELRLTLRTGGSTWGIVSLMRSEGEPPFDDRDARQVLELTASLAGALREQALVQASVDRRSPEAPGVMMFDAGDNLITLNREAEAWLEQLGGIPARRGAAALTSDVIVVLSRARAIARGTEHGVARLRRRTGDGRWVVMHASCLHDGSGAVIIEPAQASEIAPLIVEAYALTAREQQITQLLARGLSTGEIAATLFLSPHTVRDHVKATFEKVGVTSRGELVAKIFAEHYSGPLHEAAHP